MMDSENKAKELKKKIKELEELSQSQDFWQDKEKAKVQIQELNNLHQKLKSLQKYDKGNAVLHIFSGAGGQDAQDWATMLLRMYKRFCEDKGCKTKILHQSFGEAGGPDGRIGTKEVSMEIKGHSVYGLLKRENGVHRLVRLSPFSSKQLRHTSFARVEVLPEIGNQEISEIEIKDEELKIDTFRASGPGGQHVNTRESAIRITHLPTNLTAASQSERLQGMNRKKAMELLYAKLFQLRQMQKQAELTSVVGKAAKAEWGNQIRSYVLHPYQLVKDHRTKVETSNVEQVLDGEIDVFLSK